MSTNGKPKRVTNPTSVSLDPQTRELLAQLARDLGMNRSAVVREALRRMVASDSDAEVRRLVAELGRVVTGGGGV